MTNPADDDVQDDDVMQDDDDSSTGADGIDRATVVGWVKEALAELDILKDTPGEGMVEPDAEPVTIKAVEAAARRAVEDAMKPLRDSVAKKQAPKKKPAAKPAPEPEPSPAKGSPNRFRAFMWGGGDD